MDLWLLFIIFDWLLFIFVAGTVLYLGVFSIASLFTRTTNINEAKIKRRFIILIPAYKQDHVIEQTILSILAQLGDLFESHLKRTAGVKDSSQFIPGHGGFLDRFDSIIFIFDIIAIVGFVYMLHIQN